MPFVKGQARPANAGRKPGSKNKKTLMKVSDFVLSEDKNLPQEIYNTIIQIADPVQKTKLLMEFYRFVDAPVKEKIIEPENESEGQEPQAEAADILNLVSNEK